MPLVLPGLQLRETLESVTTQVPEIVQDQIPPLGINLHPLFRVGFVPVRKIIHHSMRPVRVLQQDRCVIRSGCRRLPHSRCTNLNNMAAGQESHEVNKMARLPYDPPSTKLRDVNQRISRDMSRIEGGDNVHRTSRIAQKLLHRPRTRRNTPVKADAKRRMGAAGCWLVVVGIEKRPNLLQFLSIQAKWL